VAIERPLQGATEEAGREDVGCRPLSPPCSRAGDAPLRSSTHVATPTASAVPPSLRCARPADRRDRGCGATLIGLPASDDG